MADAFADISAVNDTGAGTIGDPKKFINSALGLAGAGDTVFVRKGVYTEVISMADLQGKKLWAYNGEDVTLDAQGTRATIGDDDIEVGDVGPIILLDIKGIKFVNYTSKAFGFKYTTGSSGGLNPVINNCFFKAASKTSTLAIDLRDSYGAGELISVINSTFVGHNTAFGGTANCDTMTYNIFDDNNYSWAVDPGSPSEDIDFVAAFNVKDYNAYPSNPSEPNGINTSVTDIDFVNPAGGDYALLPSSALRRAGPLGENIGASFYPRLDVGSDTVNLLSSGINDELYYETGVGPGTEGPVDAGPALFAGGVWKIDNATVPGAKSCRVKFGPLAFPPGTKLYVPGLTATEDETLGSGLKEVIGVTDATRDVQISINGGAKQAYTFATDIDTNAATIDMYVTIRRDGV